MSTNAESAKAKTQVKDSQQTHEQPMEKLLSLGDQRMERILENCIRKVEIAATLDAVLRSGCLSGVEDKTLSRALQGHQMLAERLEMQEGLKQESGGGRKGEGKEASMRVVAQLERGCKNSGRDLLRYARDHTDDIFGLRAELGLKIRESECLLINELRNLHSHTSEKLQISVNKEPELPPDKKTIAKTTKIVSLDEEVTKATMKVDKQISDKSRLIKTLQTSLQEKKTKEAALSCVRYKLCPQPKISKEKQTSIEQKTDELNIQLNNLILKNRNDVREQQTKNEKVESDIENLQQNFDEKIEGVQANLELNEIECKNVEEELKNQQKSFTVLEMEVNQIQERHHLAEERRREEMRELELRTKAAILIQEWWRRYSLQRRKERGPQKGKKDKKGKGKGKKAK